jgi:hypothetical protein
VAGQPSTAVTPSRARILHCRFNRIQTHALIADCPRFSDQPFHQYPYQAPAALAGPNVQPLHLADAGFKLAQRNASRGVVCATGQQQYAVWRTVTARKVLHFFIETLETQAEAQRAAIFEKESASLFDVFGEYGPDQFDGVPNVLNKIAVTASRDGH